MPGMHPTSIETVDAVWNPLPGCENNCHYCYARGFARRFYHGSYQKKFRPWVDFEELNHPSPLTFKKPHSIFVGSMGDMWGPWVKDEHIERVLEIVNECYWHTFYFLTKFPGRYSDFERFPKNCWLGVTCDGIDPKEDDRRQEAMPWRKEGPEKYIMYEPLLRQPITTYLGLFSWVIVGAQTGPGAKPINPSWLKLLVMQTQVEERGIPIYVKRSISADMQNQVKKELYIDGISLQQFPCKEKR